MTKNDDDRNDYNYSNGGSTEREKLVGCMATESLVHTAGTSGLKTDRCNRCNYIYLVHTAGTSGLKTDRFNRCNYIYLVHTARTSGLKTDWCNRCNYIYLRGQDAFFETSGVKAC